MRGSDVIWGLMGGSGGPGVIWGGPDVGLGGVGGIRGSWGDVGGS